MSTARKEIPRPNVDKKVPLREDRSLGVDRDEESGAGFRIQLFELYPAVYWIRELCHGVCNNRAGENPVNP